MHRTAERDLAERVGREREWIAATMVVVAVVSYAWLAPRTAPGVTSEDPAEFQTLVPLLGVPHSGYPLYVTFAHVVGLILPGNPAARVNLFSALTGAVALSCAFWLTWLLTPARRAGRWIAGVIASLLLGTSHTFVLSATIAEMYTLYVAMALATFALLVLWADGAATPPRLWLLASSFGLLGALLGVHATAVALYPGALFYVGLTALRDRREGHRRLGHGARAVGVAAGAWAAGALGSWFGLFWILWSHHQPLDHWALIRDCPEFFRVPREDSFARALAYEFFNLQYRHEISSASADLLRLQLAALPHRFAAELFPVGALAAFAGLLALFRARPRLAVFLSLVIGAHAVLAMRLNLTFKTHFYFLLPNALGACIAASSVVGAAASAGNAIARWGRAGTLGARAELVALLLATALAFGAQSLAIAPYRRWVDTLDPFVRDAASPRLGDRPNDRPNLWHAERVRKLVRRMPPGSIVFADWYEHYTLKYVAHMEGLNTQLQVFESYPLGTGRREFPTDYLRLISDPSRSGPVFFVFNARPPELVGYELLSRGEDLYELVRDPPGTTANVEKGPYDRSK